MPAKKEYKDWVSIRIKKDLYDKLNADKQRTGINISKRFRKLYEDQAKMEHFLNQIGGYDLVWIDSEGKQRKASVKTVVDKIFHGPKP